LKIFPQIESIFFIMRLILLFEITIHSDNPAVQDK
jgi:hypothetical protein